MRKIITACMLAGVLVCTGCSTTQSTMSALYTQDSKISSETSSFNLNKEEQSIEGNQYTGKIEFEGMDTLWTLEAEGDQETEFAYRLSVTKGKAKLVFITPDGEVQVIAENVDQMQQEEMKTVKLSIQKGENRIKLVAADQANIDLQLSVGEGTLETLGFAKW